MKKESLFRITFINQETIYEIYAKKMYESDLFGFIEIEDFVFGETSLVISPAEERLKIEFNDVKRTYVPMHAILRIDEVKKEGVSKARDRIPGNTGVSVFPMPISKRKE